ncbi:MAG: AmmeMemoRadiSam system radical SAM enzyme [Candidatus Zixiibacteriota bacterium]|nr:MAG: AmmeMemoRadiSam system radical SAM enzyme [candidate division Zixibacteria bacterium]
MKRRVFLRCLGCGAVATVVSQTELLPEFLGGLQNAYALDFTRKLSSVEARFYNKLDGGGIMCGICPRRCFVADGERGHCDTRENRKGIYHTLVYGFPCALNIDPIEKKPLFHFYPGTSALSLATAGCNVDCKFCQNWEISQSLPEETNNYELSPQAAVDLCHQRRVPTIAYTYSEPVIFYEYMYDMARIGHEKSIKSVMITGGYINEKPMAELLLQLDAVKIDLKSIRKKYYKDVVRGELGPVLKRLLQVKKSGVWLEIVNLVVPTLNDTEQEFREMAVWIKANLGADTPLHFSRFHPEYLLTNLPPTSQKTLQMAYDVSRAEGLEYVYLGNLPGHPSESTYCPRCGVTVIGRSGYRVNEINLNGNHCKNCNHEIPGLF